MRIIVNGQQAFGKAVLEALLERGEDVIAVYCPEDKDGRVDPLTQAARDRGLPVHQPKSFKTDEAVAEIGALKPDLGVMAFVTKFVPSSFLNVPTHGTIQYHPSLLPLHRGPSSINWPIIMGRTETGLSIFWPDDGLDTGPILLQKTVAIEPDDTLGSVYFDKLFPLGVEAMLEAVDLVRDGKAPRIEQDESKATYESWCKKENVGIDWSKPAAEIYNLIRGANPSPGAWTTLGGKTVEIFDSARSDGISGAPGTVTAISADGIAVAAGGGGILIKRVRSESRDKVAAADFAGKSGLSVGTRFGT
jgi:methionyl-tRNA formyltransferase